MDDGAGWGGTGGLLVDRGLILVGEVFLVIKDIRGGMFLLSNGVGFDLARVVDFAWILGSRGWDGGAIGDDWEPGGAGDGGK